MITHPSKEHVESAVHFRGEILNTGMPMEDMWHEGQQSFPGYERVRLLGGVVLKRHTNDDYMNRSVDFSAAKKHFRILSSLGMKIVPFAYQPISDDSPGYVASKFIPNSNSLDRLYLAPDDPNVVKSIQSPLRRYARWLIATRQERFLEDIFHERQFSLEEETQSIFLHDVDPYTMDVSSTAALKRLTQWTMLPRDH